MSEDNKWLSLMVVGAVGLVMIGYCAGRRPEFPDLTKIVCGRKPIQVSCTNEATHDAVFCVIAGGAYRCTAGDPYTTHLHIEAVVDP